MKREKKRHLAGCLKRDDMQWKIKTGSTMKAERKPVEAINENNVV